MLSMENMLAEIKVSSINSNGLSYHVTPIPSKLHLFPVKCIHVLYNLHQFQV